MLHCKIWSLPFLTLHPMPSTPAQSKERKGSNFAIWQPWADGANRAKGFTAAQLASFRSRRSYRMFTWGLLINFVLFTLYARFQKSCLFTVTQLMAFHIKEESWSKKADSESGHNLRPWDHFRNPRLALQRRRCQMARWDRLISRKHEKQIPRSLDIPGAAASDLERISWLETWTALYTE